MRLLVCGSRTYSNEQVVWETLHGIWAMHDLGYLVHHTDNLVVISGEAKGADRLAKTWAQTAGVHPADTALADPDVMDVLYKGYAARWNEHHPDWCPGGWCRAKSYCVAAGPRRNQEMLDTGIDQGVAFVDKALAKSRGTADMVQRLEKLDIPVRVVRTK